MNMAHPQLRQRDAKLSEEQVKAWFCRKRRKKEECTRDSNTKQSRLSKSAIEILKKWFDEHISDSNPLPSAAEKEMLEEQTGLSQQQIKNWLAHERQNRGIKTRDRGYQPPSSVVETLKKWYNEHNRYPSKDEKVELVAATGLTEGQVKAWFRSERARRGEIELARTEAGRSRLPKSPVEVLSAEDAKETSSRLQKSSFAILKKWSDEHISDSNPFPSIAEKEELGCYFVSPNPKSICESNPAYTNGRSTSENSRFCRSEIQNYWVISPIHRWISSDGRFRSPSVGPQMDKNSRPSVASKLSFVSPPLAFPPCCHHEYQPRCRQLLLL